MHSKNLKTQLQANDLSPTSTKIYISIHFM